MASLPGGPDPAPFDAGLDILAPRRGEVFGRRRGIALVEVEPKRGHADAAELDIDVRAFGEFGDVLLPAGQDLLAAAAVGADAEDPADMGQDDRGAREGAGKGDRIGQLRVVLPGFEAEAERREPGKALAEFGVAHQMRLAEP